ncbi:MAG: hypothetical protein AAGB29_04550 [Planctomycetota bacterium]
MIDDLSLVPRLKAALLATVLSFTISVLAISYVIFRYGTWWQVIQSLISVIIIAAFIAGLVMIATTYLVTAWFEITGGSFRCVYCKRRLKRSDECTCADSVRYRDRLKQISEDIGRR